LSKFHFKCNKSIQNLNYDQQGRNDLLGKELW
jgi:hypothetical protein